VVSWRGGERVNLGGDMLLNVCACLSFLLMLCTWVLLLPVLLSRCGAAAVLMTVCDC